MASPSSSNDSPFPRKALLTPSEALMAGGWSSSGRKTPGNDGKEDVGKKDVGKKDANAAGLSSDEVEVVNPPPKKKNDPIALAEWDDVVASTRSTHPLKRLPEKATAVSNPDDFTCLESIAGVPSKALGLDALKRFCTRMSIHGLRRAKKKEVCDAIAHAKIHPADHEKKKEAKIKIEATKVNAVNRKRFMNVCFSSEVKPLIILRGEVIGKDDMTDGNKSGQTLFEKICMEHNNPAKHGEDHSPDADCRADASKFAGPITWKQAKKALNSIIRECEVHFRRWKRSGNHGSFEEEAIPFVNFCHNDHSLLCLHEFVVQHPDVFEQTLGRLPEGAFRESGNGNPSDGIAVSGDATKKKPGRKSPTTSAVNWSKHTASTDKKNSASAFALCSKTQASALEGIQAQRAKRKQLFVERAEEHRKNPRLLKEDHKAHVQSKIDNDGKFFSQESFFEEIEEIDSFIKEAKNQQAHAVTKCNDLIVGKRDADTA